MAAGPPTIDPVAARRWQRVAPAGSPFLHDEIARRMAGRLEWILLKPARWAHWEPVRGGGAVAQPLIEARYPDSKCFLVGAQEKWTSSAIKNIANRGWRGWLPGAAPKPETTAELAAGSVEMLWANMALHLEADPEARLAQWHGALAPQGFVMFSCLGPDTVRDLRELYAGLGWPPAGQAFTDMHDWGDMLVAAGFAEPVMDMERVTLTWSSAAELVAELRTLGRNLHPARFPALRGRGFRARLERVIESNLRGADGRFALDFEIAYGHALKPAPRLRVAAETVVPLEGMRERLKAGRPTRK